MRVSRVLEVVVVPQYCTPLRWLRDGHPAVFTHYRSFVNQPDIDSFIKDLVVLEAMLDCCIIVRLAQTGQAYLAIGHCQ